MNTSTGTEPTSFQVSRRRRLIISGPFRVLSSGVLVEIIVGAGDLGRS